MAQLAAIAQFEDLSLEALFTPETSRHVFELLPSAMAWDLTEDISSNALWQNQSFVRLEQE